MSLNSFGKQTIDTTRFASPESESAELSSGAGTLPAPKSISSTSILATNVAAAPSSAAGILPAPNTISGISLPAESVAGEPSCTAKLPPAPNSSPSLPAGSLAVEPSCTGILPAPTAIPLLPVRSVGAAPSCTAGILPAPNLLEPIAKPAGEPAKFEHVPFLDGLRAWAIMSVLTFHSCGPIGEYLCKRGGWLGVDAFFVLSGFLITSILLKEQRRTNTISLKHFYLRRALRLVPAYAMFLVAIYFNRPPHCPSIWPALGVAAAYMVDYDLALSWGHIYGSGLEIAWSLSVEEKFYMLWPTIMKNFRKYLPWIAIATICACFAWKTFLIFQTDGIFKPTTEFRLGTAFDTKVDGIMLGCLSALALASERARGWIEKLLGHGWIPAALVVILVFYMRGMGLASGATTPIQKMLYYDVRIPLFTLLFAALILALSVQPRCLVAKFFSLPPITWIGRISYSMYLWHSLAFTFTIIYVFNYTMPFSRAYLEVVDYGMAILFAAVSYYVVEKPFLNLKDRIGHAPRSQ